jgi:hypothetical protein
MCSWRWKREKYIERKDKDGEIRKSFADRWAET